MPAGPSALVDARFWSGVRKVSSVAEGVFARYTHDRSMNADLHDLIAVLRGGPAPAADDARDRLLAMARFHGLADCLQDAAPAAFGANQTNARRTTAQMLARTAAVRELSDAMRAAGLTAPIVLKGLHLAHTVYARPHLRSMVDVDLLVHRPHVDTIAAIVQRLGYRPVVPMHVPLDLATAHHLTPVVRGRIQLELHWRLLHPALPGGAATEEGVDEFWARAVPFETPAGTMLGLCPEDLLLHLCSHAVIQHLFEHRLRALWDIALVLHRHGASLEWSAVRDRAQTWGVARGAGLALSLVHELELAVVPAGQIEALLPEDIPAGVRDSALAQLTQPRGATAVSPHVTRLLDADLPWRDRFRLIVDRTFLVGGAATGDAPVSLGARAARPFHLVRAYLRRSHRWSRADTPDLVALAGRRRVLERWLAHTDSSAPADAAPRVHGAPETRR